MRGNTTIYASDGDGSIYLLNLGCEISGKIFKVNSNSSEYIFDPSTYKRCNVNKFSGSYFNWIYDKLHKSYYKIWAHNHASDLAILSLVNNKTDLQIEYNVRKDYEYDASYSMGGTIIIKNFIQGAFGITLVDSDIINDQHKYYEIGNSGNNNLYCLINTSSYLYGFGGNDTYEFYVGNHYNCTLNGYLEGVKKFKAYNNNKSYDEHSSLGVITINDFQQHDLLDLSSLEISPNDITYKIINDTSIITLPNGQEIVIPYASYSLNITFDGISTINPAEFFSNIIPPYYEKDLFMLHRVDYNYTNYIETPCQITDDNLVESYSFFTNTLLPAVCSGVFGILIGLLGSYFYKTGIAKIKLEYSEVEMSSSTYSGETDLLVNSDLT